MPIATECPHCGKGVKVADSAAGKRVNCPRCQEPFRVSAPSSADDDNADTEHASGQITAKRKLATRGQAEEADRVPERPRKKKSLAKKKRKSSPLVLMAALGATTLLVGLVAGGIWLGSRGRGGPVADNQAAKPEPAVPAGAFAVENAEVLYARFTPDGTRIFSCASDGIVSLWDAETGKQVHTRAIPSASCAALAQNGKRAVVGTSDGTLRILDVEKWQEERAFAGHQMKGNKTPVMAVAIFSDGRLVASTGLDYSVRAWDAATGHEVWHRDRFEGDIGTPRGVAFHTDTMLYVGYSQGAVVMYRIGSDHELGTFRPVAFDKKLVQSVTVCPRGPLLATGDAPEVVVMDQQGTQTGTFRGHTANTITADVSRDGRRAVSGGNDKVVRVWDVPTAKEVQAFEGHTGAVTSVAFSPDGKRVVSASRDRTLRLWTLAEPVGPKKDDPTDGREEFRDYAKQITGRWSVEGFKDAKVTWEFRDDATFTITANRGEKETAISGTWKVAGIGLGGGVIQWSGEAQPSEFFQANEKVIIDIQGDRLGSVYRDVRLLGTRLR